jgi:hypothetical protein
MEVESRKRPHWIWVIFLFYVIFAGQMILEFVGSYSGLISVSERM